VGSNELTGAIPDLSGTPALSWFSAENNRLNGSIPPLSSLAALEYFNFSGNQLNGVIPALPANLAFVGLGNNRLTGQVPAAPPALQASFSTLCPNPLDLTPSENDSAWNIATGHTPWWAYPSPENRCDALLNDGFDM